MITVATASNVYSAALARRPSMTPLDALKQIANINALVNRGHPFFVLMCHHVQSRAIATQQQRSEHSLLMDIEAEKARQTRKSTDNISQAICTTACCAGGYGD
jgi:hypothetical protein